VQKLHTEIECQEKRQANVQQKMQSLQGQAKQKMSTGDKRGALNLMKRSKMYQKELDKIENVKATLEMQAIQVESAASNKNTLNAMLTGNKTMKKIRKDVGLDNVDAVMDDIREEMEYGAEINLAISQQVDPFAMDDDDLMAELNAMTDQDTELEVSKMPSIIPKWGWGKSSTNNSKQKVSINQPMLAA